MIKPFQLIVADPGWKYGDKLRNTATRRGAADQYREMTLSDIKALPINQLAADRAVLALWVTSSHIFHGGDVLKAWGFRYTQMVTWGKVQKGDPTKPKMGMGRLFRLASEHVLIGVRGGAHQELALKNQVGLFLEPPAEHSAKPETLQDRLELMFPSFTQRLEIFARRKRRGWRCMGNEIDDQDLCASLPKLATRVRR